ncbi:histidine phosphatase superfamily [Schizothecium vesticola]|uniref:Histidine phosphatase superfamily n=1 Tax=Schizothecium vesticola TaxID=314040 RepID=A0AA40F856_9PEZI|nr:histidine phosphatase superfamily [Schizothecium vesticola]
MAENEALTPRVFIVRHGETEWAKQGRQTGKTVVTTASHLAGEGKLLDPTKLARVFVSPRKRAQQTLQGLLGSHLDAIEARGVEITATEGAAEWDYGEYEGLKLSEVRGRRKEKGLDGERKVVKEQVKERLDRVITAIREIQGPCMRGEKAADVLVVAHGVILRAYKSNSVYEPAFHVGIALPVE